jgi:hypothetical protein
MDDHQIESKRFIHTLTYCLYFRCIFVYLFRYRRRHPQRRVSSSWNASGNRTGTKHRPTRHMALGSTEMVPAATPPISSYSTAALTVLAPWIRTLLICSRTRRSLLLERETVRMRRYSYCIGKKRVCECDDIAIVLGKRVLLVQG